MSEPDLKRLCSDRREELVVFEKPVYNRLGSAGGEFLRRITFLASLVCLAAVCACAAAPARADDDLLVGFDDDWLKEKPLAATAAARAIGAGGFRISLNWKAGQTQLSPQDRATFDAAIPAAFGLRIVLVVVGGAARYAPQTASARNAYCSYVKNVLQRYPTINDVIVWNEPNKTWMWRPQFDASGRSVAPAAYEALLARCWDVLHAYRPYVNLLGPASSPNGNDDPRAVSNISHSPASFIAKLGAAYRSSGRTQPIFDNIAHHMYGATPAERPWRVHEGSMVAQGDWRQLILAFRTAFAGTRQPVPGYCVGPRCAQIWYMETGYQTAIDPAKRRLYRGAENVPNVVPDRAGGEPDSVRPAQESLAPDQATQIRDGIQLAYCQPYVGAFFNYLLRDDRDLAGWQSGALWRDGTPKGSYSSFVASIDAVAAGTIDCAKLKGGALPLP